MKKIKVLPKKYYILIPIIVLFSLFLIGCILFFYKEVNKRSDKFTVTSNSDLNQNLKDNNDLDLKNYILNDMKVSKCTYDNKLKANRIYEKTKST